MEGAIRPLLVGAPAVGGGRSRADSATRTVPHRTAQCMRIAWESAPPDAVGEPQERRGVPTALETALPTRVSHPLTESTHPFVRGGDKGREGGDCEDCEDCFPHVDAL